MPEQTDKSQAHLRDRVHKLLQSHNFDANNTPNAQERLLDVFLSDDKGQVHIASDGLNLEQKASLERFLIEHLPGDVGVERWLVYFRPRNRTVTTARKPPATRTMNPLGIKTEQRKIPNVKHIIAVASGKGGVGKSTVAVNTALALAASGAPTGILDLDVYGPSIPMMLGAKGPMGVNKHNALLPVEVFGLQTVSFGFLQDPAAPIVWRGPLVAQALEQLFYDVAWDALDYLVLDLPPGTGDVQLTMIEKLPIAASIIVTTPQDLALLDVQKAVSMFKKLDLPILGVVENMAVYQCPQCGHAEPIFGTGALERFADQNDLSILASIPLELGVRLGGDCGRPAFMQPGSSAAKTSFQSIATALRKSVEA